MGRSITVGGATLQCWKHGGHGQETYLEVVENSCNLVCKLEKLVAILKFKVYKFICIDKTSLLVYTIL